MARYEEPPFGRGESFMNRFDSSTNASSSDAQQYEGREWEFEDLDAGATPKVIRSAQMVRVRAVRNVNAGALLPKRLANLALAPIANGGYFGGQIDGYATTTAARGYPIDEFLPSGGVQPNDIFYIVVKGPAMVLTDIASLSPAIGIGDSLISQTAATSGATTAGRVISMETIATTAATLPQVNLVRNMIGRAMSAATTNNTNTGILCDVGKW